MTCQWSFPYRMPATGRASRIWSLVGDSCGVVGSSSPSALSAAALESLSTVKDEQTLVFLGFRSGWSTR